MNIRGNIDRISHRGKIIARFPEAVPLGSRVFDNKNSDVGSVTWIFGPVDRPYVEIKPFSKAHTRLTSSGREIYVEEEKDE